MTVVKICGLTSVEDACFAAENGADMLGFIFAPVSKRYISPAQAAEIIAHVRERLGPPALLCIGVFVVTDERITGDIAAQCALSGVDAAQLVALADPGLLSRLGIPAYACIRPESPAQALQEAVCFEQVNLPGYLPTLQLDAFHPALYGGTGESASQEVIREVAARAQRLMLAGGLTPENVAGHILSARPWAVDVASGTETTPGRKDPAKVRAFIQAVKGL
jgi:phosphoribosylanthranilate isomerase